MYNIHFDMIEATLQLPNSNETVEFTSTFGTFNLTVDCISSETPAPTRAPTPSCMMPEMNATTNHSDSDLSEFNGLNRYKAVRTHCERPIWERSGDIEGQNIKYYAGNWVIHGSELGVLAHPSTAYFAPIEDDHPDWLHPGRRVHRSDSLHRNLFTDQ